VHARLHFLRVQYGGVHVHVQIVTKIQWRKARGVLVQLRGEGGAVQVSQPVVPGDGGDAAVETCREAPRYILLRCVALSAVGIRFGSRDARGWGRRCGACTFGDGGQGMAGMAGK
jgi:hypothetical protein